MPKQRIFRKPWRVAAIFAALIAVFASPYIANEIAVTRRLDEFSPPLPEGTSVLKARTSVETIDGQCLAVLGKTLASELPTSRVRDFYVTRAHDPSTLGLAWQQGPEFWVSHPIERPPAHAGRDGEEPGAEQLSQLPRLPRRMLTTYAMLPQEVHRLNVFTTLPWGGRWDPRCL